MRIISTAVVNEYWCKILAKIIAMRLQPFVPALVLPDQSGFVQERSTMHNLRTLFAVLHYLDPEIKAAAVFLDAAKAFDCINWGYMFLVLGRMGLPPEFVRWIRLLYNEPMARVKLMAGYLAISR